MKKNLLFLILIISLPAFSQNWAPINSTEKFCYSSDDTLEIINNVLWVDSVKSFNNQEVYYMNKIVKLFDEEQNHYMYNEPQFLADSIIISEDGSWEFVDAFPIPDDGGFKIYPLEDVGFQWNFLSGIIAEIIGKDTLSVFDEIDSVKTIQLSNNQQIVLSKEHGIINWRDEYTLVGIEGRDLGTNVFMFEDMFKNVDAGDVFCTESFQSIVDLNFTTFRYQERLHIISIEKYADSVIIYGEKFSYSEANYSGDTIIYNWENDEASRKYYRNDSTDIYPNLPVTNSWENSNQYPYGTTISKISNHEFGGLKKTQIVYPGEWGDASVFDECENLYPRIYCPTMYDLNLFEYSVNYGILEYEVVYFENGKRLELVGVIDDGDTIGTIYPIDMFVGTNQLTSNSNWLVYPNPAKDFITLETSLEKSQADYKIYNINGLLLKEGVLAKNEYSISVNEFPAGMYFIELNINGEKSTKKWIKN